MLLGKTLVGNPRSLHAFVLGYEPIPLSISLDGCESSRYLLEPVTAAVVEYVNGWVLLDSGFNVPLVRDSEQRAQHFNYDSYTPIVPPGDPLQDSVARAGLSWSTLAGCAISHAHIDHTGGLRLTGAAPIFVQRREWDWLLGGANKDDVVLPSDLLDNAERVVLLDGDTSIAPGLIALSTPRHTPGNQSFMVKLPSRTVVLACDAADLRENIDGRIPCGSTVGSAGREQAQQAIDRLADLAASGLEVWPGHDPNWWAWRAVMEGRAVKVS